MSSCRGGCDRPASRRGPVDGTLALIPADARVVAAIDFATIRSSSLWKRFASLASDDPRDKKTLDELRARTGLNPFEDVHRLVAAFPEDARRSGAFALVFHGERFDQRRLVTYVKDRAALKGRQIVSHRHGARTFWSTGRPEDPTGFFLDDRRFVLAGGGWAERIAALADGAAEGKSAAATPQLARLIDRVAEERPVWLAAIVGEPLRRQLSADAKTGIGSLTQIGVGLAPADGLMGEVVADFSNPGDAGAQARRLSTWLDAMKGSPAALLLGAGPYIDAVKVGADGSRLRLAVALSPTLARDLVARLSALRALGAPKR